MRVFIVNSMCGSGSTGRIVSDTYQLLKKHGDTVKIAYGLGNATNVEPGDAVKINDKRGYYCHNLLSRVTDKAGLYSKNQTQRLVREIETFNPDIIQLHNLHGYWLNYRILFEYLETIRVPIVWTLHDCWSFTGHCSHFDLCGCEQWKVGCRKCVQLKEYPKCYLWGRVSKNYALKKELFTSIENMTIVTPSEWLADKVKESFLGKYRVQCIHNGIDRNVFKPRGTELKQKLNIKDKKIILSVSSVWNKQKGLFDLFELSKLLPQDYKMIIVGLDDKQIKLCPPNVLGIRRTESVIELSEYYSLADVFVNMTYEDTFPTVNLEALACGTPVITYSTGGSPEAISHDTGVVIRQGHYEEVLKAIMTLQNYDKQEVRAWSEKFDKWERYKEYIVLYTSAVEGE